MAISLAKESGLDEDNDERPMKAPLVCLALTGLFCGCDLKQGAGQDAKETPSENIDAAEMEAATKLSPARDPVEVEVEAANRLTRQAFEDRRFEDLETQAAELRASKAVFANGSWKIAQFYFSLECDNKEPESTWQLHDAIYQAWIAAKPDSISARVAYAEFMTNYAWQARGTGFADTVSDEGWKVFGERLEAARQILAAARTLKERILTGG